MGPYALLFHEATDIALPTAHVDGAAARSQARLDIGRAVSHHVGTIQVNPEIGGRSQQESRLRFAAIAPPAIAFPKRVGVVQAVKRGIEVRAHARERALHLLIHLRERPGREVALGNPRLIRDHDDFELHSVEPPDGFAHPGAQMKLLDRKRRIHQSHCRVMHDVVNHAVAVKEDCSHTAA